MKEFNQFLSGRKGQRKKVCLNSSANQIPISNPKNVGSFDSMFN